MERRFYYTLNPGEYQRERIRPGADVLIVATAHWHNGRKRFSRELPPLDRVGRVAIDSGGFTAERKYGGYPWSLLEYVEFIQDMKERLGDKLEFAAVMDYACTPGAGDQASRENLDRIDKTHENDLFLRSWDSSINWLSVLQGDNQAEREYALQDLSESELWRYGNGYYGLGSIVGRPFAKIREVLELVDFHTGGAYLHAFGLHANILDKKESSFFVRSWDSYSWCYGRGKKVGPNKPKIEQLPGESYSKYTGRLAEDYWSRVVEPRLNLS